jgi:AcrR family transcriptional regulator
VTGTSTTGAQAPDRPALIRRSLLELVAERGFHGASMALVAERAGVAAGTIYVHHASKDDLVLTVYREVKADLATAAVDGIAPTLGPEARFSAMWRNVLGHLSADPVRARFLLAVDTSPYAAAAHSLVDPAGDPLVAAAAADDMAPLLADLPLPVIYDLGFGPAVRIAAAQVSLSEAEVSRVVRGCWRAVTR